MASVRAPVVWYLDLKGKIGSEHVNRWSRFLSPEELVKADSYRDPARRLEAIASRALLRKALSYRYDPAPHAWRFGADENDRPHVIAPVPTPDFNIAHASGMVVVGISDAPPIGVDVEHIDRAGEIAEIRERVLAQTEAESLSALKPKDAERWLVTLWTLKEARAKATGEGLAMDFRQLSFRADEGSMASRAELLGAPNWHFFSYRSTSGHILSAATKSGDLNVRNFRDATDLMAGPPGVP